MKTRALTLKKMRGVVKTPGKLKPGMKFSIIRQYDGDDDDEVWLDQTVIGPDDDD